MAGSPRIAFPVDALEERFLELVPSTDLVLSAPTGSGKSTRVPLWCRGLGRVLVVEPRRIACRTLAGWVAGQLDEKPGASVGYAVRFESRPGVSVEFVTPGVALGWAVEGRLGDYAVLVVDEFHERGWQVDLFLALARRLAPQLRLVVMSATLEGARLARRLDAEWLAGEGRMHPVDVVYAGEVEVPSGKRLPDRVVRAVRRAFAETGGNVLVFLPGMRAISECANRLNDLPVVRLHGSFSHQEQDRAFQEGPRKVILSTNVAESSVTVPGVTAVVDAGLVKQFIHRGGHSALATVAVSQASADQRRGRAGRVCPGVCYRLWSEQGKLESSTAPELSRIELTDLVMWTAAAGLSVQELDFVDPPPEFAVERAVERLERWGLIDSAGLTELGRRVSRLPLPVERGQLLAGAPPELAADVADLCAALESRNDLFRKLTRLPQTELDAVVAAREKELGSSPPLQAISALRSGDPARHHLDPAALEEARRIADQLRALSQTPASQGRPDSAGLARYLLERWPERAFVRRKTREAWANGECEVVLAKGLTLREGTQAAVMLEIEPVEERGLRTRLVARNPLPVSFALMAAAGLGTPRVESAVIEGERILAEVSLEYAGRELGRDRREVAGRELRQAFTRLVLEGRLLGEAGARLREEVQAWNLWRALEGEKSSPVVAEVWLLERLAELGLEEQEDWPLVSAGDLAFPGLPAWEREKLESRYPHTFSAGAARYSVEYQVERGRVVLHWQSGHKNAPVSPSLLPRWNGWKVQLNERGRLTTLRD